MAREESDDSSASEGGDFECFQRGRMVKPFEDTVFALAPGQISDVVKTQFGYHVIKLDGIYKDAEAEAVGRRETAKSIMISHEGEALAAETAKKVLAAVKAGAKLDAAVADSLPTPKAKKAAPGAGKDEKKDDAAKSAKDESMAQDSDRPHVEISAPFNANGDPITGVSAGQSVAQIVFKLEKDGDTPDDLVKLDDGYAVVQLKEKTPATKEQFETERETFVASLLAGKQYDALNGYILRLKEAAKSEMKLNEAYSKTPDKEKQKPRARRSEPRSRRAGRGAKPRGAKPRGRTACHEDVLPNGLRVFVVPRKGAHRAVVNMLFRVGSRFETRETNGIFISSSTCCTADRHRWRPPTISRPCFREPRRFALRSNPVGLRHHEPGDAPRLARHRVRYVCRGREGTAFFGH